MSLWIAGITRGHNAGVCLLKDGEVVFALEEERLTRKKYDGSPFASMDGIKWVSLISLIMSNFWSGKVENGVKFKQRLSFLHLQ